MTCTRQFLFFMIIILGTTSFPALATSLRPWSINDTLNLSILLKPYRSPDGQYQAVVTTRSILENNQLESKLWLFDTSNLKAFIDSNDPEFKPAKQSIATMCTVPIGSWATEAVITDLCWSADSKTIYFLARSGKNSERRLFSVNRISHEIKQVSKNGQDVTTFAVGNDTSAYMSKTLADPNTLFRSAGEKIPDIVFGAGQSIVDLLYPNRPKYDFEDGLQELWIEQDGKLRRLLDPNTNTPLGVSASHPHLSVSPDGKFVIVAQQVTTVPSLWEKYRPCYEWGYKKFVSQNYRSNDVKNIHVPERFMLIDVMSRRSTILVDAPLGVSAGYYDAVALCWSPNGEKLALSGVYYPLSETTEGAHLRPCVIVVDMTDKTTQFVSERPLERDNGLVKLQWSGSNDLLEITYEKLPTECFRFSNKEWNRLVTNKAADDVLLESRESFNHPPVLTVKDANTNKEKVFFDPNPQLNDIDLTNVSILRWTTKNGREITAGLVKPYNYKPGKRYPLLIQAYGFHPETFFADGYYRSAFPGRALAGRGICVLQVDDVRSGKSMKPEGAEDAREAYLSAIDQLDSEGLIDRTKVGIIGFSHSGFYVLHTLTKSPDAIRAAVLAECTTASFTEYLNGVDWASPAFIKDTAGLIGADPFEKGFEMWGSDSPGFNTDKIKAAVMCQYYSPTNLAFNWSIFPALRAQGKAAELLYIRGGTHELLQPKQRFLSQETTADWFDFWLNNHEDPDPAKKQQYVRWRTMPPLKN